MSFNVERLCQALAYEFRHLALCQEALTHRSFGTPNNERLEFLGDAVLDFVVAHLLYQQFPQMNEGQLSRLRANLVQQRTLASIAADLHLRDVLFLGKGEKKNAQLPESILADAVEALLGAIFVDSGFQSAARVIEHLYREKINALDTFASQKDCKSRLQEFLQAQKNKTLPEYTLLKEEGAAHNKRFWVCCKAGKQMAQAFGHSRKAAEQKAAELCLKKLQGQNV